MSWKWSSGDWDSAPGSARPGSQRWLEVTLLVLLFYYTKGQSVKWASGHYSVILWLIRGSHVKMQTKKKKIQIVQERTTKWRDLIILFCCERCGKVTLSRRGERGWSCSVSERLVCLDIKRRTDGRGTKGWTEEGNNKGLYSQLYFSLSLIESIRDKNFLFEKKR